jgi:hypothetical protein
MRAIFIDAFNQKIEEINIPIEVQAFQREVRRLLRTEHWEIVRAKVMLTVIIDELALSKDTPSFWVDFLSDFPIFGNVICVGRHPFTQVMEDLDDVFSIDKFFARWCDMSTTENYKKIIWEYIKTNR